MDDGDATGGAGAGDGSGASRWAESVVMLRGEEGDSETPGPGDRSGPLALVGDMMELTPPPYSLVVVLLLLLLLLLLPLLLLLL